MVISSGGRNLSGSEADAGIGVAQNQLHPGVTRKASGDGVTRKY